MCCLRQLYPAILSVFSAGCAVYTTWEAVIIGVIGGTLSCLAPSVVDRLRIDDPVGAVAVHGLGGLWVRSVYQTLDFTSKWCQCSRDCVHTRPNDLRIW